jgi:hypothetical protein
MTTYTEIREKIRTWDVFFTASPALFSRLIRLFTRSKVSHCGVFLWLGNRLFIIEALDGKGVAMKLASDMSDFRLGNTGTRKCEEDIINTALMQLGTWYDLKWALLALFVDTKTSQKFCSEFVAEVLSLKFPHLKRGILPSDVATVCGQLLPITMHDAPTIRK